MNPTWGKLTDKARYSRKLLVFFTFMAISVVLLPILSGDLLYGATAAIRQNLVLAQDEMSSLANHSAVKKYSDHILKTETLLASLKNTVYSSRILQNTIAEELLKSGLTVETFSVRNIPNKERSIPNAKKLVWENFDFARVALNGKIPANKISDFILFLATREKIWYISALEIRPLDSPPPADLVSRFRNVENEITPQGRNFEKNSILEAIANRTNKDTVYVSLLFIVPIDLEGGSL
jgi:hypothetical protein